jgi:hypothetical protein
VKKLQKQIHNVLKLHKIKNGPGAGAIQQGLSTASRI